MRAVWRESLQFEQVRLELLQALRRFGYALRGPAACGLICACHASQVTLPMPLPLPWLCRRVCFMLPCCQQGEHASAPGWRARHMHMPAHARSCPAQELPLRAARGHRLQGIDSPNRGDGRVCRTHRRTMWRDCDSSAPRSPGFARAATILQASCPTAGLGSCANVEEGVRSQGRQARRWQENQELAVSII